VVKASTKHFLYGLHYKLPPRKFIAHTKTKNVRIQGIGHRLHSAENPDARVKLLQHHAKTWSKDTQSSTTRWQAKLSRRRRSRSL